MGELLVEDGVIRSVGGVGRPATADCEEVDCCGDYLAPGFIDLHCHGAAGYDAMEATPDAWEHILGFHASRGTTRLLLSTVSAAWSNMLEVLCLASSHGAGGGARLEGIHLEGPYFSPLMRGAHCAEALRLPSEEETIGILEHAQVVHRVTLAPELPGALALVSRLRDVGVEVSAGHSNATAQEARAGFAAGIRQATHLYNCMSSLRKEGARRVTGLAEEALVTRGVVCEVIPDGWHLPSALLRLAWLSKGWEETVLVTDATAGAGLADGKSFVLGGKPCRLDSGAAWTGEGEGKERCLAGSTIGMIDAVRHMTEECSVPLGEAVAMASLVPARTLRLDGVTGALQTGKKADLVRFSPEWRIKGVWLEGREIGC